MYITHYNPTKELKQMRRSFDYMNQLLDEIQMNKSQNFYDFVPSVNTREGDFSYHIEADLPGIKKEDIEITLEDEHLIISGERKEQNIEYNYYNLESHYGKFARRFRVPENTDIENIHAESKNGVLEIVLPKLEENKTNNNRKITIN